MRNTNIRTIQHKLAEGHTETWLKTAIILVALGFIVLALMVNSTLLLAGILLYLILP